MRPSMTIGGGLVYAADRREAPRAEASRGTPCQHPPGTAYGAGGSFTYRITAVTPAGRSDPLSAVFGFGCNGAP